ERAQRAALRGNRLGSAGLAQQTVTSDKDERWPKQGHHHEFKRLQPPIEPRQRQSLGAGRLENGCFEKADVLFTAIAPADDCEPAEQKAHRQYGEREDQCPFHTGVRFSMNAAMPSVLSSVAASRWNRRRSRRMPSPRGSP